MLSLHEALLRKVKLSELPCDTGFQRTLNGVACQVVRARVRPRIEQQTRFVDPKVRETLEVRTVHGGAVYTSSSLKQTPMRAERHPTPEGRRIGLGKRTSFLEFIRSDVRLTGASAAPLPACFR